MGTVSHAGDPCISQVLTLCVFSSMVQRTKELVCGSSQLLMCIVVAMGVLSKGLFCNSALSLAESWWRFDALKTSLQ